MFLIIGDVRVETSSRWVHSIKVSHNCHVVVKVLFIESYVKCRKTLESIKINRIMGTIWVNSLAEKYRFSTLREKSQYFEFFWSVFSPNGGKYGPKTLWIRTLFRQCKRHWKFTSTYFLSPWKHFLSKNWCYSYYVLSTHFKSMFHFYTPWEHQKTSGFLMFSEAIKIENLLEMGLNKFIRTKWKD